MNEKKDPKKLALWLDHLTREAVDRGLLIEAGWLSLRKFAINSDAPDDQLREMQMAFFAGAQHLFASMMTIMEPGAEPTRRDLKRMDQINDELERFAKELSARLAQHQKSGNA
jgi:hypothetical protein